MAGTAVPAIVRAAILALCAAVATTVDEPRRALFWVLPLGVVAALASRARSRFSESVVVFFAEGLLAGLAIAASGSPESPYLPYLIAPAFAGGLRLGVLGAVLSLGAAASTLLVAPWVSDESVSTYATSSSAQWVVLALLVGLVASWVRSVLRERLDDPRRAQVEAFRLLTELRDVARHLPGTLDPTSTGEAMLQRAREVVRYDVGAVLVGEAGGTTLAVLVRAGRERPRWDLAMTRDGVLTDAWREQEAAVVAHRLATTGGASAAGSSLVLPLNAGDRPVGLLVLESGVAQAFPADAPAALTDAVQDLVLQLQTGLVFTEVRELATHEERQRLAREIHDGIAQELASVAYALDGLALDVQRDRSAARQVELIRAEVRRLITELRMSLFDLRSEVAPEEGLGAAISRHVHQVGTASGMTVHLSLNETPVRLAAEVEAELLRIVQEAVANARKHACAENLWVGCTVNPPAAVITVEDDGTGLRRDAAPGNHGLAIMRERAARIRAELSVEPRQPQGTRVRLTLDRVRP